LPVFWQPLIKWLQSQARIALRCICMTQQQANLLHHVEMSKQLFWASCAAVLDIAFHMLDALLNPKFTTMHNTSPVFFLLAKPADKDVQVIGEKLLW